MKRLSALFAFSLLIAFSSTPAAAAFLDVGQLISKIIPWAAAAALVLLAWVYLHIHNQTRDK